MSTITFPSTHFLISAAKLAQLPDDSGYEIAFAGRSNAGKSTALNAITNNKKLAKTSKTPGRTQLINFFTIDNEHRLVDLPGYGYAKVSQEIKERWQQTLAQYLSTRQSLCGLVLMMDIRHPFKDTDQLILAWAAENQLPVHILLTKADKLSRNIANKTLQEARRTISQYPHTSVQLFSATHKLGIEPAQKQVLTWLQLLM